MDRLTALFQHVKFQVLSEPNPSRPRLRVQRTANNISVSFCRTTQPQHDNGCDISLDFGSQDSPLLLALPAELHVEFSNGDAAFPVAQMILSETEQARCGSPAVLDRLFEVLMILLLRRAIELGQESTGLLAGLADDHLKHALVAVHEDPGAEWSTERLADLALMSRTAFYQRFNKRLGMAPMQYVRNWRMSLARLQLAKGERVGTVGFQLGYKSQEGFSRAFHQHFGLWPADIRNEHDIVADAG